jgi:alpha-tubulin suppressor-like RCC1 family protein
MLVICLLCSNSVSQLYTVGDPNHAHTVLAELLCACRNVSFKSIAAGRSHVVAIATDGRLFTWGT